MANSVSLAVPLASALPMSMFELEGQPDHRRAAEEEDRNKRKMSLSYPHKRTMPDPRDLIQCHLLRDQILGS
jgi:hypothetical protein